MKIKNTSNSRLPNYKPMVAQKLAGTALILAVCLINPLARAQSPVRLAGFDSPPFVNVSENRQISGAAYDFVTSLLSNAQIPFHAEGLPLGRLLGALDDGNTIAAYLVRTPEREAKYTWIAALADDEGFHFITRAGEKPITSYEEAKSLKTVGSMLNGVTTAQLRAAGLTNLDPGTTESMNAAKLIGGRLEAWYANGAIARHALRQEKIDKSTVVIGPKIVPARSWIVGSKTLPTEIITKLQTAYAEAQKNGSYATFRAKID